ncbi:MAG: hypothetical protein JWO03_1453 [Bacteroidetes bacterium]|nr:hypothetical protein [Bacteroidota bacterium]
MTYLKLLILCSIYKLFISILYFYVRLKNVVRCLRQTCGLASTDLPPAFIQHPASSNPHQINPLPILTFIPTPLPKSLAKSPSIVYLWRSKFFGKWCHIPFRVDTVNTQNISLHG